MTLDEKLKEIKESCEAATDGPWRNTHEMITGLLRENLRQK